MNLNNFEEHISPEIIEKVTAILSVGVWTDRKKWLRGCGWPKCTARKSIR